MTIFKIKNLRFGNASRNGGFTLLELIVSLGIASALTALLVAGLFNFYSKQNLDNDMRAIVGMLRTAQEKAIGQEQASRWGVYFSRRPELERGTYTLFAVNETLMASSSYTEIPGEAIEQHVLGSNVQFEIPPGGQSPETFALAFAKATGLPSEQMNLIMRLIDDPTTVRYITVSAQGSIDYQ